MNRRTVTLFILLGISEFMLAAVGIPAFSAPVAPFGAGQILQQVQPNLPAPKAAPPVTIHNTVPTHSAPSGGLAILVTGFRITGNTLFKTAR
ncbi:MAG: hypothetical protein ACYDAM_11875, partial [Leptospirales bacterium]